MGKTNWMDGFAEQTPDRRASGYTLQAICLVITETHCLKCKSITRHSTGTMLKLKGGQGEFIYVKPKESAFDIELPRERQNIPYHVDACEQCFVVQNVHSLQPGLFDEPNSDEGKLKSRKPEYVLVGTPIGKKELLELKLKAKAERESHSNLLQQSKTDKKKKEKEKAKEVSILELF